MMPSRFAGIETQFVLAGLLGALVKFVKAKDRGPWELFASLLSGAVSAAYLTPVASLLIARSLGVALEDSVQNAVAFCIGLTAMEISERLIAYVKNRKVK